MRPIAAARRRNSSVLLHASPSGSIAASFHPIHRWPQAGTTSVDSSWVVAGRTMSAYRAVSVRNCSWTTVKRSSRARPRRVSSAFGTITSGFEFHTIIAATGGSRAGSVSASPSRLMLSVRGDRPASRSGRLKAASSMRASWYGADAAGEPTAAVGPRAHERRQHGERAVEHRSVLVVLGADQGADRGRPDRAVVGRERLDDRGVETTDRTRPLRRPAGDVGGQFVEAEGVGGDPVGVDQAVADQYVHHRQHQGDVGARQRLDELVGGVGRGRADRVDHDQLGARGSRGLDGRPEVAVRQPGVGAPQQDQPAVTQLQRVETEAAAVGHPHAVPDRGSADRATSRLAPRWWKKRPSRPMIDSRLWLPASLNGRIASGP